jgi:hypothetical protein
MEVIPAFVIGATVAGITRLVIELGGSAVRRNMRQKLINPSFMTSAEKDPYLNREYARPDRTRTPTAVTPSQEEERVAA